MLATGDWHHAYILKGDRVLVREALLRLISERWLGGAPVTSCPDFHLREYERLSIEASRELAVLQSRQPLAGGKKFFVIICSALLREAQNALLKTLEEPAGAAHFFFIIEGQTEILPTLLSRVRVIETGLWPGEGGELYRLAQQFLAASPTKRLALIEPLLAESDHLLRRTQLERWLALLEKELAPNMTPRAGEAVAHARYLLTIPGSVPKLLLEELALVLPVAYNQTK